MPSAKRDDHAIHDYRQAPGNGPHQLVMAARDRSPANHQQRLQPMPDHRCQQKQDANPEIMIAVTVQMPGQKRRQASDCQRRAAQPQPTARRKRRWHDGQQRQDDWKHLAISVKRQRETTAQPKCRHGQAKAQSYAQHRQTPGRHDAFRSRWNRRCRNSKSPSRRGRMGLCTGKNATGQVSAARTDNSPRRGGAFVIHNISKCLWY